MSASFPLPQPYRSQGWRAKIRGWERVEPPHVTLMRKTQAWRLGLRDLAFLDTRPNPADVPDGVLAYLRRCSVRCEIARAWDDLYPHNPVPVYADCDACAD